MKQLLRGNQPDIVFRYLELRNDKLNFDLFCKEYKEHENLFINVEYSIFNLCKSILSSYFKRFIYKQYVFIPKPEYVVMSMCHEWHKEDRINNKININKVS